ncbi:MAG TPA: hypothetical protein VGR05_03330 [Sphingomicrobium sp.]|nr:hypothetical protein [Sphingomicrobium sp.]
MLNIISIIIGAVALLFAIPAFLPVLALAYYLIIPLAIIGAVIGAASSSNVGRNLNLFVIVVGVLRLMLTGGFF